LLFAAARPLPGAPPGAADGGALLRQVAENAGLRRRLVGGLAGVAGARFGVFVSAAHWSYFTGFEGWTRSRTATTRIPPRYSV
jgi:hypothetical protein